MTARVVRGNRVDELTDSQSEALHMLVSDARCQNGVSIGKGTDRNAKTINGRVARGLIEIGLAEWLGGQPDGFVIASDDGRAWVRFGNGIEAGTEQLIAEATRGLDDEARAELEAAALADHLEDQNQDTLLDDECRCDEHEDAVGDDWHVDGCDGRDIDADEADEEDQRTDDGFHRFEGRDIDSWVTKVTGGSGHRDPRHLGERVVLVVEGRIGRVAQDLKDGVLTREQTVKVDDVMTVGAWLREPLLRVLHQERRGASDQPQLWDGDDDLAAERLVEKLNREELEVRDEDGRRDWDDDDLPPTVGDIAADAVDELLAAAEASRPQWRVEPGTGNATDLWVVIAPEGETPIGGAWATDGDAIVQVEERTGPLDWQQTPGGAFIAVEDEA